MSRLFGTDGIRGLANRELTAELALGIGWAATGELLKSGPSGEHERGLVVVGQDSRASGEFLSAAVIAGVTSAGADVLDVGIVPTPAVAHLTEVLDADFGVMLSASHNPMPDNGIKLFAAGGHKLPDSAEDRIESAHRAERDPGPIGAGVGRVRRADDAIERYATHVVDSVTHDLAGLKVVVDAANGAASVASPVVLRRLGADVIELHTAPNGYNINEACGSTHVEDLQQAVVAHGAHAGIAHDGDADRCLAVDEAGRLVDGDQIMAVLAMSLKAQGRLRHDTVVATVMSNLGFRIAMEQAGITVRETAVGDRYVLQDMLSSGCNLGGEQSGHLLLLDHATTGDGTMTAAHLLSVLAASGRALSDLAAVMTRLPQVLINVAGVDKALVAGSGRVDEAVITAQAALGDSGRVLLRPSGTEPVVRVMVEAQDEARARSVAARLADVVATTV